MILNHSPENVTRLFDALKSFKKSNDDKGFTQEDCEQLLARGIHVPYDFYQINDHQFDILFNGNFYAKLEKQPSGLWDCSYDSNYYLLVDMMDKYWTEHLGIKKKDLSNLSSHVIHKLNIGCCHPAIHSNYIPLMEDIFKTQSPEEQEKFRCAQLFNNEPPHSIDYCTLNLSESINNYNKLVPFKPEEIERIQSFSQMPCLLNVLRNLPFNHLRDDELIQFWFCLENKPTRKTIQTLKNIPIGKEPLLVNKMNHYLFSNVLPNFLTWLDNQPKEYHPSSRYEFYVLNKIKQFLPQHWFNDHPIKPETLNHPCFEDKHFNDSSCNDFVYFISKTFNIPLNKTHKLNLNVKDFLIDSMFYHQHVNQIENKIKTRIMLDMGYEIKIKSITDLLPNLNNLSEQYQVEIRPLLDNDSLTQEGELMKHCVGSPYYLFSVLSGDSFVFSLIDKNTHDRSTLELNYDYQKGFFSNQHYTYENEKVSSLALLGLEKALIQQLNQHINLDSFCEFKEKNYLPKEIQYKILDALDSGTYNYLYQEIIQDYPQMKCLKKINQHLTQKNKVK